MYMYIYIYVYIYICISLSLYIYIYIYIGLPQRCMRGGARGALVWAAPPNKVSQHMLILGFAVALYMCTFACAPLGRPYIRSDFTGTDSGVRALSPME